MLVLALSMCFVKSKTIANNGDGLNTNIFTTFLLKKCLFIYTYWHFGSAKKPNFRTKKAPYIGICQFKVLLLAGRPWVPIPPGRPIPRKHCVFRGFLFLKLLLSNRSSSFHATHTIEREALTSLRWWEHVTKKIAQSNNTGYLYARSWHEASFLEKFHNRYESAL